VGEDVEVFTPKKAKDGFSLALFSLPHLPLSDDFY
jgi:hypothetical protein